MRSAAEIGEIILGRLRRQAEHMRESGLSLRAEIRSIMAAHKGPDRITAKHVLARLTCRRMPSIRTIQWHMKEIHRNYVHGKPE